MRCAVETIPLHNGGREKTIGGSKFDTFEKNSTTPNSRLATYSHGGFIMDFKKIAESVFSSSPLQIGRTQIETSEVIGQKLTIIGFDFAEATVNRERKVYPVIIFKELPDNYYNGGTLLMNLCRAWSDYFDGNPEAASEELERTGGVTVFFSKARSQNGNDYTKIEVK